MLPVAQWLEIDRYALALTRELQDNCRADYDRYEFHRVVQALQTFCSEDLGGFYLDILKDRLYTTAPASAARRSAQSALWHITQSFVRLLAPITAFTAEEVWQVLGGTADDSVMFQVWHELPKPAGRGRPAGQVGADPRGARRRDQGAGSPARSRQDRLGAAGGGRDPLCRRKIRCAGLAGR
jgi:isoleucyl-tRNA synthetase